MELIQQILVLFKHGILHGLHGRWYRLTMDPRNVNTPLLLLKANVCEWFV